MRALSARVPGFFATEHLAKRTTDIVVAAVLLFSLTPVLLVVALAVWLSSPGPILFRQLRVRSRGQLFEMLKFRTLLLGEENIPSRELQRRGHIRYIYLGKWCIGRWLRQHHIDELPQLFNVLKGEMSLVGLRPTMSVGKEEEEILRQRRAMGLDDYPVGITGLYQTGGGKDLDLLERLELERDHVANSSYGRDCWIMIKTIFVIITGKGAGE